MTYKEVKQMLDGLGIPAAYHSFKDGAGQQPPFLVYYYPTGADFMADNRNYAKIRELNIEIYTDAKDFELEARMEELLDGAGLPYGRTEAYIESERMHMANYYTEVIINE